MITFTKTDKNNIPSALRERESHYNDLADLATDEHCVLFNRGEASGILNAICTIKEYYDGQNPPVLSDDEFKPHKR